MITMSPLPAAKMSHARHSGLRVQPMKIGRTVLGLDRVAPSPEEDRGGLSSASPAPYKGETAAEGDGMKAKEGNIIGQRQF